MKLLIAMVVALMIGAACRLAGVPSPCPPQLGGALIVLALTVGYAVMDWLQR